ncbi:MAG: cupin [Thermomicrobiales bacterium]|jgi:quercetin dioxygenase-like cupin family protein|nr:MAG: cupin [Thermomicrobiales bacterium]
MSNVTTLLGAEGLDATSWSNGPDHRYPIHAHGYDKVIVVVSGSIRFGIPGATFDLTEGDRLELPAGTRHDAVVGASGVVCLEAHQPTGTFDQPALRVAGTW